jgi:hypothetical protein
MHNHARAYRVPGKGPAAARQRPAPALSHARASDSLVEFLKGL